MNFSPNFILIPAVIIATAVIGSRYTTKGLHGWYETIKKPTWTPPGSLIGAIWTFLYIITGLAILWYWNVPIFSWVHYVAGAILLVNAYMNATWNKIFFVDHNLPKAYQWMNIMNATSIVAAIIMYFSAPIAAFLMIPYIIWVGFASYLTKEIIVMNNLANSSEK